MQAVFLTAEGTEINIFALRSLRLGGKTNSPRSYYREGAKSAKIFYIKLVGQTLPDTFMASFEVGSPDSFAIGVPKAQEALVLVYQYLLSPRDTDSNLSVPPAEPVALGKF